jgi:3-oxoacyl-[acyl-carrier protein] reductase
MMFKSRNLKGKVAIITGASRGVGRVIAARIAQAGAQTVLVSRSRQDLKVVADEILATSPSALNPHMMEADIRSDPDVEAVIRGVIEKFGQFHILVNNAAAFARGAVADMEPGDWDNVYMTNTRAPFLLAHYAGPHFVHHGGGDIVNIASTSGKRADPGGAAYAASKFGMAALAQSLFAELRSAGVRVTTIFPSAIDTSERELSDDYPRPDRLCSEDVADAVVFSLLLPRGVTVREIEIWNTGTHR